MLMQLDAASARSELEEFLRYSALAGKLTGPLSLAGEVPMPFAYSFLLATNECLRLQKAELNLDRAITVDAPKFKRALTQYLPIGVTPDQRNRMIKKLCEASFVTTEGKTFSISPVCTRLAIEHAQGLYRFFTGEDAPRLWSPSLRDWCQLNVEIALEFFVGKFGRNWKSLRDDIEQKMRDHSKLQKGNGSAETRAYTESPFNWNPTLGVLLLCIAAFEPLSEWELPSRIAEFGLTELAGNLVKVGKGVSIFEEAGVVTGGTMLALAPDLADGSRRYIDSARQGMGALRSVCDEWGQRTP
jgi:hypothetical protein